MHGLLALFRLIFASAIGSLCFAFLSGSFEYLFANYIWFRQPFPDQLSLLWQLQRHMGNPLEISMFALPFMVGAFLYWSAYCPLRAKIVLMLAISSSITSAFVFTVVGGLDLSDFPMFSLGFLFLLPVLVVIISATGIRYAYTKSGT